MIEVERGKVNPPKTQWKQQDRMCYMSLCKFKIDDTFQQFNGFGGQDVHRLNRRYCLTLFKARQSPNSVTKKPWISQGTMDTGLGGDNSGVTSRHLCFLQCFIWMISVNPPQRRGETKLRFVIEFFSPAPLLWEIFYASQTARPCTSSSYTSQPS